MPNSRKMTHVNVPLTTMSVAYRQEADGFVSNKLFPIIQSQHKTGNYYSYSKADFFRSEATLRADFTKSKETDYNVGVEGSYLIQRYAIGTFVSDEQRIGTDSPLQADSDATWYVTDKLMLLKEQMFMDKFVKPGVWNYNISGVDSNPGANQILKWSDPTSNPIQDIRKMKRMILKETGVEPTKLLLSKDVYDTLLDHEDIRERIQYVQRGVLSKDLLASLLEVDEILVSKAIINNAGQGANADMNFIMGDGVALFLHVAKNPGLRTVSAGYCFQWQPLPVSFNADAPTIRKFSMPELGEGVDKIEAEICFDFQPVCKDLGIYMSNLV